MRIFETDSEIRSLLSLERGSYLIFKEGKNRDIIIGVPHHSPQGLKHLPCGDRRISDENAGFAGYYLSRLLDCSLLIASNYFIDVNKYPESDYSRYLNINRPDLLVEIHGHSGNKTDHDIEISSGSRENNAYSLKLAALLNQKTASAGLYRHLSICGDFDEIFYQATQSYTITNRSWISYHIELPVSLRLVEKSNSDPLPGESYGFYNILAEAIREVSADINRPRDGHQKDGEDN